MIWDILKYETAQKAYGSPNFQRPLSQNGCVWLRLGWFRKLVADACALRLYNTPDARAGEERMEGDPRNRPKAKLNRKQTS